MGLTKLPYPWQTKSSRSDQNYVPAESDIDCDLSNDEIEQIFDLADAAHKLRSDKVADGRIMATLFYEPSTRTAFLRSACNAWRLGHQLFGYESFIDRQG